MSFVKKAPQPEPERVTMKRLRAEKTGLGLVRLVEETVTGVVTSSRVLVDGGKVAAADEARRWYVAAAGPNRTGDTGL